jgi:hypothetical protein
MIQAQKVACINHAGFVMSFVAQTNGARSFSSGNYPINETRTIDLGTSAFREGLELWPVVDAVLGKTEGSSDHFIFAMNGQTVTYEVKGTTLDYSVKMVGQPNPSTLPDFPAGVPLDQYPFTNWAGDLTVQNVWTCAPRTPQDAVAVCNWAAGHGFRVRARGVMHGWSPLTVTEGMSNAAVLLVDLTKSLHQMTFNPATGGQPPMVRVGTGALMIDLLTYLESQPGGGGAAPGYSFPHTPAPGNLTVGGVLAINAHGTAVPTPGLDELLSGYGSMSNRIIEITAVVTDPQSSTPTQYTLRTFKRGEGDDKAFLAHIGRALVVEAVLEVVPNYNLRCQSWTNLPASTLFPPSPPSSSPPDYSFADFVNRFGRVEIIWFPFTSNPWLHVWQMAAQKPDGSRQVSGPYNYPFADNLDSTLQAFLQDAFGGGGLKGLTPQFGEMMFTATDNGLDGKSFLGIGGAYPVSRDIWGPSKDVLLYIGDTTLKVTANGYAVQLQKAALQQAVHDFTAEFSALLSKYQGNGEYPVNSALEIRVTSLDDPSAITVQPGMTAQSPVISSLCQDEVAKANGWDVALWLDVLTIPGTPNSNDFYTELEQWLLGRFTGSAGRVYPEWSKGWAYTSAGPWTSQQFIQYLRGAYTTGRGSDHTWSWEVATLQKYDRSNLFGNPFLDSLFATS